jgi:hypothetical protein
MSDTEFLTNLRESPFRISPAEFEEKIILDYVNIENYDLLIGHNLAHNILINIVELQPEISFLKNLTLLDCDLYLGAMAEKINSIYTGLLSIQGLWLTGVSKIAHLLNDKLLPILNLNISAHFGLLEGNADLISWLQMAQKHAREAADDFSQQGFTGSPEAFLSEKIGYSSYGYQKSLVKFLDEYFWLRFGDNLPIPPQWVPPHIEQSQD